MIPGKIYSLRNESINWHPVKLKNKRGKPEFELEITGKAIYLNEGQRLTYLGKHIVTLSTSIYPEQAYLYRAENGNIYSPSVILLDRELEETDQFSLEDIANFVDKKVPVKIDQIMSLLVKEKIGMLGRTNIPIAEGDIPQTDGKTILLPSSYERIGVIEIQDAQNLVAAYDDPTKNPNTTLHIGSLFHEASHIKYGSFLADFQTFIKKNFDNPVLAKRLLNIIEDVRVEHLFNMEYAQDERRYRPLRETGRYFVQQTEVNDDLNAQQLFILLLGQKSITGYTTADLNKKYKKLRNIFRDKKVRKGFKEAITLVEKIKDPHSTLVDSMKLTQNLYKLISDLFGNEEVEMPDDGVTPDHNYDQGPIPFEDEEDLDKYEDLLKDATERMQDAFETDHEKIRENNDEYQENKPEVEEEKYERGLKEKVQDMIDKLKGKDDQDAQDSQESSESSSSGSDESAVQEYVRRGLQERGYSAEEADKIAREVDL